ncbi:MAG: AAA family ATPase [Hyphomicrobiales bacterium]|nr:AAA family ATPase [Hyphomicrobiales bacterium]
MNTHAFQEPETTEFKTNLFRDLLEEFNEARTVGTEDVIMAVLPLMRQSVECHASGQVVPLNDLQKIQVQEGILYYQNSNRLEPKINKEVLSRKPKPRTAFKFVDEITMVSDEAAPTEIKDLNVAETIEKNTPRYLTSYRLWEVENGHHDPLTDIFGLGLVLASLATGLDFSDREQLESFVRNRKDIQRLNGRLHPVLSRAIERMTALERYDRAQDLASICDALENHRRIGSHFEEKLDAVVGKSEDRNTIIIKRLRSRLYDTTRRNRLVYHKPIAGELNLTETSVPLVINPDLLKPDDLFTATAKPTKKLFNGEELVLGDYLRFEEMLFAPTVLSKLRIDASRDEREFGFSPLRLIPVMLHWFDLKNAPDQPITSPLLLMPATLKRRKGLRDAFTLSLESSEAEINPVLAYVLEQLYGIKLPNRVDLGELNALQDLYELLKTQILSSEPGIAFAFDDKPKRRLLHTTVKRRLDQFNKRRKNISTRAGNIEKLDYSYDRASFKPAGIQMFRTHVRMAEAPYRNMTGRPLPRYFNLTSANGNTTTEKSKVFAQEVEQSESRYDWSFNTCSVVLGNFNYRKMSLVRDFDDLVTDKSILGETFNTLFDSKPRALKQDSALGPLDLFKVIEADQSQDQAIANARQGKSLVIQGPPGTGKSQTITNLIADYVGQGKSVLFVCQKRAALDVVSNRLSSSGLGDLTAAFHDSRGNRAEFIGELNRLYNNWSELAPSKGIDRLEKEKSEVLNQIIQAQNSLRTLTKAMVSKLHDDDPAMHELLTSALVSRGNWNVLDNCQNLDTLNEGRSNRTLPSIKEWNSHKDAVEQAILAIQRVYSTNGMEAYAESRLLQSLWQNEDLCELLTQKLGPASENLKKILSKLDLGDADQDKLTLEKLVQESQFFKLLAPLIYKNALGLLDMRGESFGGFQKDSFALSQLASKATKSAQEAKFWTLPLEKQEAEAALLTAQMKEGGFFSVFSSDWKQVKSIVQSRTDKTNQSVTQKLTYLLEHIKNDEAYRAAQLAFREKYGFDDPQEVQAIIQEVNVHQTFEDVHIKERINGAMVAGYEQGKSFLTQAEFAQNLKSILETTEAFFVTPKGTKISSLLADMEAVLSSIARIRTLQPSLKLIANAPTSIWSLSVLNKPDLAAIELELIRANLRKSFVSYPGLISVDAQSLELSREKINKAKQELYSLNVQLLVGKQINQFRNDLVLSNRSASSLSKHESMRREEILKGRRTLEHEFGKSRSYKSPRELFKDNAGRILSTMKPIWLMSPLSVADVLPLEENCFDVVIFDEASQIPVEEALPSFVRAPQSIIVGDDKQLPPSNYFNSSSQDEDFDDVDLDFELNQDSLLTLAGEKIPGTMLKWHYRSRQESLIAFSNASFYDNDLLTIPSSAPLYSSRKIEIEDPANAKPAIEDILDRGLSFHHLPNAIYTARSNEVEAIYIAKMIKELLSKNTGKTIGVVAFSEAQQFQIELVINELAEKDDVFAAQFAQEQGRVDDGEYNGLFIKNLENVQGDERDIIIVSVCYGPNVSGKMRMNFGPINKTGGEKRLNVIFSRAKEHMAIISSITGDAITNDYNTGALALKTMLEFAEATSCGNNGNAEKILKRYQRDGSEKVIGRDSTSIISDFANYLREEGNLECQQSVGLSSFTIDIVVASKKATPADTKPLAVLIDRSELYGNNEVEDLIINRASILESFGWRVVTIPLKDIYLKPYELVKEICERA